MKIPDFKTKAELFKFLVENKEILNHSKESRNKKGRRYIVYRYIEWNQKG